jgi:hypothetical protein
LSFHGVSPLEAGRRAIGDTGRILAARKIEGGVPLGRAFAMSESCPEIRQPNDRRQRTARERRSGTFVPERIKKNALLSGARKQFSICSQIR